MLTTVAAVGALPCAAHAVSPADHPDAELVALGRQFDEQAIVCNSAEESWSQAYAVMDAKEPEVPEVLHYVFGDHQLGVTFEDASRPPRAWCDASHVDQLRGRRLTRRRERPVTPADGLPPDAETIVERVPAPELQARADEIVKAHDAWAKKHAALDAKTGCSVKEKAYDHARDELDALEDRIMAIPATTIDGVFAKARVANHFWGRREGCPYDVELMDLAHRLAWNATADLLRIAGATVVEIDD